MSSQKRNNKVIVGMSGGIDSSVAAWLLKYQGFEVEGLFMNNWEENEGQCSNSQDFYDAQQVCQQLKIKLHKVNFSIDYWDNVFSVFLENFRLGKTPNPDIICNSEIKFKIFIEFATKKLDADYIATGHYVRKKKISEKQYLLRGYDLNKDQSYFLCSLKQEQIQKSVFPIGNLTKRQVRSIANFLCLVNYKKQDSRGICFIGAKKFKKFLENYINRNPGKIQSTSGSNIGNHDGLCFYTIGQRKGLGIGGLKDFKKRPWYVVDKCYKNNKLIVTQNNSYLMSTGLLIADFNWINNKFQNIKKCTIKIRYRQTEVQCTTYSFSQKRIKIKFKKPIFAVTPGQSAVLYLGNICLGGGLITKYYK